MKIVSRAMALIIASAIPAMAENIGNTGYFAGIEFGVGQPSGTSNTTDAGAAYGGGGTVRDVKFDNSKIVRGHFGYNLTSKVSIWGTIAQSNTDVRWATDFAAGGTTYFAGEAVSRTVMANVGYSEQVGSSTAINVHAGAGVARNTLKNVGESADGVNAIAQVAKDTKTNLALQFGAGVEHALGAMVSVGGGVDVAYLGGFQSGDYRTFGGGSPEAIGRYEIGDVWEPSVSFFVRAKF